MILHSCLKKLPSKSLNGLWDCFRAEDSTPYPFILSVGAESDSRGVKQVEGWGLSNDGAWDIEISGQIDGSTFTWTESLNNEVLGTFHVNVPTTDSSWESSKISGKGSLSNGEDCAIEFTRSKRNPLIYQYADLCCCTLKCYSQLTMSSLCNHNTSDIFPGTFITIRPLLLLLSNFCVFYFLATYALTHL